MNDVEKNKLIKKAKKRAGRLKKLREDERYKKILGRLKYEGLIEVGALRPWPYKINLEDALWVGENIEPRVLELLPALIVKRPSVLLFEKMPEDLRKVVVQLRKGEARDKFRGIPAKNYEQWLEFVGRKGKLPKVTKTFRFSRNTIDQLEKLSKKKNMNQTELIEALINSHKA